MGRLILRIAAPIVGVGALFGAAFSAKKFGLIEVGTWAWLWPTLVAVVLLAAAVFVLLRGAHRWLWPLVTGFVVQTVGVVLYKLESLDYPWQTLLYTGVAIAIVLLGMGIYYLEMYRRARKTEQGMLEAGLEEGVDPEELAKIRENMNEAISLMRRAGAGRNAIYELPWFLVVGRPSAGKTVAIKKSGLGLPVKKDWVKGVGGTYSCDFFFTNDLIFMDTPGRWVRDGADDKAKRYWESLLKLLRRYRGRRPLDGLVVVVSAEDLAGGEVDADDRVDLEDQAANIREIIDLVHENLNFRFPVYLLISKVDLVTGFTDFFWGIPAQRRHEILGWSNPDPNEERVDALVHKGVDSVLRRLERYRLELLAKLGRKSRARRLYFFSEELKQIREPLADFARVLFYEDPSRQTPIFRGFYFTSGMQGVGSPVSKAIASLAKNLNIQRRASAASAEEEGDRSFFLLELFRELMVGDEGLIGRTAKHWWKQRRNTAFGAFLPAGLAALFLLLSGVSLLWNLNVYRDIRTQVPAINAQLLQDMKEHEREPLDYDTLTRRLKLTDELRNYHRKLTNLNPFRRFGMRRAEDLSRETFEVYKERFSDAVLQPTLRLAQDVATTASCADRVDVFYSVVWMRLGRRFDTSEQNMAGFDIVWSDFDVDQPGEIVALRNELLKQFRYLVVHDPTRNVGGLLRGFEMRPVAEALQRDCDMAGSGSALDTFRLFQLNCSNARSDAQLQECYTMLEKVAKWDDEDTDRYLKHIRELQDSLSDLKSEEGEAGEALALLNSMDLGKAETSECVAEFAKVVQPLKEFAIRPDLLEECKAAVEAESSEQAKLTARTEVIKEQVARLDEGAYGTILKDVMLEYSQKCRLETLAPFGIPQLDFDVVNDVAYNYRREACIGFKAAPPQRPRRPTISYPTARAAAPRAKAAGRPVVRASSARTQGPFVGVCSPPSDYSPSGWERRLGRWQARYAAAEDPQMGEARQQAEKQQVQGEVRGFGRQLTRRWMECLGQLQLQDPSRDAASWLDELATSPDYVDLLGRPAADAAEIAATAGEEPMDAVVPELEPLTRLAGFEGKVEEYQSQLGQLAQELRTLENDPDKFYAYRTAFEAGNPDNSLVKLQGWVRDNVSRVADGKLVGLFSRPLQAAEGFVRSPKLINAMWRNLVDLYKEELASRFPFAGGESGADAEPADLAAVKGVFGFEGGIVNKIRENTPELGPRSKQWLDRARTYSEAFFKEGTDEPNQVRVTLGPLPITADDEELGKKYRVEKTMLSLAPGVDLTWSEDADVVTERRFDLDLFGDDASQRATLRVWVAEHKNAFIAISARDDWKDAEPKVVADLQGNWAPLRLLREALQGDGNGQRLVFKVPWSWGKKKEGNFAVPYSLRSDELSPLLKLLDDGFPAPPDNPTD